MTRRRPPTVTRSSRGSPGTPRGCCASSTRPACCRPPTSTWRAGWPRSPASATRRCCWPSRWPCARRGSATCSSTWRGSATRPRSTPTSRSTSARCPGRTPRAVGARGAGSALVAADEPTGAPVAAAAARAARGCTWTATGPRRSRSRTALLAMARRRPRASTSACSPQGSRGCSASDAGRPSGAGRRGRGAAAVRRRGRRPGHRQDDHGGPDRRAAVRAGAGGRPRLPLIALAAPTGKAAARLQEAVHAEAAAARRRRAGPRARCSGCRPPRCTACSAGGPGSNSRFRHDRNQRLPHDVVIVDETSMVSLSLMARLIEALRADARLVLVGDPGQLASIEAGAVLGDIVGPAAAGRCSARAASGCRARPDGRSTIKAPAGSATGSSCSSACTASAAGSPSWRSAIRRGDADARPGAAAPTRPTACAGSRPTSPTRPALAPRCATARWRRRPSVIEAARGAARPRAALEALGDFGSCARTGAARTAWRAGRRAWRAGCRGRGRRLRRRRALVRRPAAAGDRERLRAAAQQRRHRRHRARRRTDRASRGRVRARRRGRPVQPDAGWARSRPSTR